MTIGTTSAIEKRELRNVLGAFTTGVTIITTRDSEGKAHGLTANSFSSVSLDPPLVLWSQSVGSTSFCAFNGGEHFAINILADDQIGLSNRFAKSGADKFAGVACTDGVGGVPVLAGTAAHLECTKIAAYPGGDHVVYLGRVERIGCSGRRPLAFYGGRYMVPYAHELGPMSLVLSGIEPVSVAAQRHVQAALPAIAEEVGQHTLLLGVWGNHGPTVVHWEPSKRPVSRFFPPGLVVSPTRTTTGQAFCAFLPESVTREFVAEDLRQWRDPGEDEASQRARFDATLAEVRERKLARVVDKEPSVLHRVPTVAFSTALYDAAGAMSMSLGMVAPAHQLSADWNGAAPRALLRAAQGLSDQLATLGAKE
ncbi:p-hydroxyphenylacetate 3-hydroxylase, reductase component [Variovorax sp. PBS-H4]|uniref:flavin reductase family protein n=1 Tax=Variovorax sp. PBS-H4 TaxID=434008 RepID=UPI001318E1BF|nr:flavin reductase [Variovorax sp. PBS-H4]VTU27280.1 p-hydroxyphenylacetate 3-hydroxylase, reductase component [Variovorax sp. PBS-H4]